MSVPTLQVEIYRGTGGQGAYQAFAVPRRDSQTVLDVVTHIQRELDPSLAYRFACRVGVCGSCAMTVNGRPRWTCRTRVEQAAPAGKLTLAPLRNLPQVRDLVVDMTGFFDKWRDAKGAFSPSRPDSTEMTPILPGSGPRALANAAIECIGCGVCTAACDTLAWNRDYLGPAALNRAWSLVNDERDAGQAARKAAVTASAGCLACHSMGNCTRLCPKELDPAASIAGLKRAAVRGGL